MACAPTPCPPFDLPPPVDVSFHDVPDPAAFPAWTTPDPAYCSAPYTFYSTRQTFTDTCDDGSDPGPHFTISVTIPPYSYTSTVSQFTADQLALVDAEAQVEALRILFPCIASADLISTEDSHGLATEGGVGLSTS